MVIFFLFLSSLFFLTACPKSRKRSHGTKIIEESFKRKKKDFTKRSNCTRYIFFFLRIRFSKFNQRNKSPPPGHVCVGKIESFEAAAKGKKKKKLKFDDAL